MAFIEDIFDQLNQIFDLKIKRNMKIFNGIIDDLESRNPNKQKNTNQNDVNTMKKISAMKK